MSTSWLEKSKCDNMQLGVGSCFFPHLLLGPAMGPVHFKFGTRSPNVVKVCGTSDGPSALRSPNVVKVSGTSDGPIKTFP